MSIMSVISGARFAIGTIYGVVRSVEAAIDLNEAWQDDSLESQTGARRVRIATDVAVIATQFFSIVGNNAGWSPNTMLCLSVAAGAADITQNINGLIRKENLKLDDWIYFGGNVGLRVSCALRTW